jgi:hypothetical protein
VFQEFDYREYLARQGIQGLMTRHQVRLKGEGLGSPLLAAVYRVRSRLAGSIQRSIPEPQASLAQALLLGAREGVPRDVTQAFRDTGTSHLLAISGLPVGVVLMLSMGLSAALLGRSKTPRNRLGSRPERTQDCPARPPTDRPHGSDLLSSRPAATFHARGLLVPGIAEPRHLVRWSQKNHVGWGFHGGNAIY